MFVCEAREVSLSSAPVPSGWYPDPSGARQWRVWTGTQWSELTRPYGEVAPAPSIATDLSLIQALHRLVRYGAPGLGVVRRLRVQRRGSALVDRIGLFCVRRERTRGPLDTVGLHPGG